MLTRNCAKYFCVKARKHFVLELAKLNVSKHIAPLMRKNTAAHSFATSIASQKYGQGRGIS